MYLEAIPGDRSAVQIHRLWSECAGEKDFPYKVPGVDELTRLLLTVEAGVEKITLLHESGRAFASGSYIEGEERGFITNPDMMEGMTDLIDHLGNSMWRKSILGEPFPADGGRPILVPVKDGRVLGFAGPLDVERSGRGYFSGIAVDPSARGRGVAKVLFSALCANLRAIGAGYMTLFTGEDNPARRIYEAAGFTIVKSWADMKKEI